MVPHPTEERTDRIVMNIGRASAPKGKHAITITYWIVCMEKHVRDMMQTQSKTNANFAIETSNPSTPRSTKSGQVTPRSKSRKDKNKKKGGAARTPVVAKVIKARVMAMAALTLCMQPQPCAAKTQVMMPMVTGPNVMSVNDPQILKAAKGPRF